MSAVWDEREHITACDLCQDNIIMLMVPSLWGSRLFFYDDEFYCGNKFCPFYIIFFCQDKNMFFQDNVIEN